MRIEMNGMVIEGTVEELRAMGVKFPVEEGETQIPEAVLKVGDYAKVIEPGYCGDIEVGSIVKITNPKDDDGHYRAELLDGSDYDWFADDQLEKVTDEEVAKAKAEMQPKFEVGDYVKLSIKDGKSPKYGWGDAKNGDIGKIVKIHSDGTLKVDFPNHKGWNGVSHELVPATDEEVARAKEAARWAKIGRKPGEFKKGDIVRITKYENGHAEGSVVEVVDVFDGVLSVKGDSKIGLTSFGASKSCVKLIAPVEQRFDFADAEGARQ